MSKFEDCFLLLSGAVERERTSRGDPGRVIYIVLGGISVGERAVYHFFLTSQRQLTYRRIR